MRTKSGLIPAGTLSLASTLFLLSAGLVPAWQGVMGLSAGAKTMVPTEHATAPSQRSALLGIVPQPPPAPVSSSPSLPLSASSSADPADAIDAAQTAEILGLQRADAEARDRIDKFLCLVVLPLGLFLTLVVLLRRRIFH